MVYKAVSPKAKSVLGELINQFQPIRKEHSNKKNPNLLMDLLAVCSTQFFFLIGKIPKREAILHFRRRKECRSLRTMQHSGENVSQIQNYRSSTASFGGDGVTFS